MQKNNQSMDRSAKAVLKQAAAQSQSYQTLTRQKSEERSYVIDSQRAGIKTKSHVNA